MVYFLSGWNFTLILNTEIVKIHIFCYWSVHCDLLWHRRFQPLKFKIYHKKKHVTDSLGKAERVGHQGSHWKRKLRFSTPPLLFFCPVSGCVLFISLNSIQCDTVMTIVFFKLVNNTSIGAQRHCFLMFTVILDFLSTKLSIS